METDVQNNKADGKISCLTIIVSDVLFHNKLGPGSTDENECTYSYFSRINLILTKLILRPHIEKQDF